MIQEYSKSDRSKGLSANFAVGEFGCRCTSCKTILVDEGLVERLQQVRDHFDKAVVITSGYRCAAHNAEVSGAAGSRHTKGQAADFYIPGVAPAEIAKFAESIGIKGIGLYDDFVHIDTREKKSFWYGHKELPRSTFGGAPKQTFTVELSTLQRGSKGREVRAMQTQLLGHGYQIDVDGVYGPATENAVKSYQKNNNLTADGIAGPMTYRSMLGIA